MDFREYFTGPVAPFPGRFQNEHPMPVQSRILAILDFMHQELISAMVTFKVDQEVRTQEPDRLLLTIRAVKAGDRSELWIQTTEGKWHIVHQAQIMAGIICDQLRASLLQCKDGKLDYQASGF